MRTANCGHLLSGNPKHTPLSSLPTAPWGSHTPFGRAILCLGSQGWAWEGVWCITARFPATQEV